MRMARAAARRTPTPRFVSALVRSPGRRRGFPPEAAASRARVGRARDRSSRALSMWCSDASESGRGTTRSKRSSGSTRSRSNGAAPPGSARSVSNRPTRGGRRRAAYSSTRSDAESSHCTSSTATSTGCSAASAVRIPTNAVAVVRRSAGSWSRSEAGLPPGRAPAEPAAPNASPRRRRRRGRPEHRTRASPPARPAARTAPCTNGLRLVQLPPARRTSCRSRLAFDAERQRTERHPIQKARDRIEFRVATHYRARQPTPSVGPIVRRSGRGASRVGADDHEPSRCRARLGERRVHLLVERVAGEDGVEARNTRRARNRSGDELEQVDPVPRERLERPVQRARPMVGHEGGPRPEGDAVLFDPRPTSRSRRSASMRPGGRRRPPRAPSARRARPPAR